MSQLGRIGGQVLTDNLLRAGVDLAFETDLLYLDVVNRRIGIRDSTPPYELDVNDNLRTTDLIVDTQAAIQNLRLNGPNTISTSVGGIDVFINGGGEIFHDRMISKTTGTDYLLFDDNQISSFDNNNIVFDPNGSGQILIDASVEITGDLAVSGDIFVLGNLSKQGNLILGDDVIDGEGLLPENDLVDFNAPFSQDLVPGLDNAFDLGGSLGDSTAGRWRSATIVDNTNITTVRPNNVLISDQMLINGTTNSITTTQSNENLVLNPDTGFFRIENLTITDDVLSTAVKDLVPNNLPSRPTSQIVGFNLSSDGTSIIRRGVSTGTLQKYTMVTPYDFQNTVLAQTVSIPAGSAISSSGASFLRHVYVEENGQYLYRFASLSTGNVTIGQYYMSTPFDLTTLIWQKDRTFAHIGAGHPFWAFISPDGTKLFYGNDNILRQLDMSVPYDIATATVTSIDVAPYIIDISLPLFFLDAGITAYSARGEDGIRFICSTPYDLKTAKITYLTLKSSIFPETGVAFSQRVTLGGHSWVRTVPGSPTIYPQQTELLFQGGFLGASNVIVRYIISDFIGIIRNDLNTPLKMATTGIGYLRFIGDNAFVVPAGTDAERNPSPEIGDTRWNTDQQYLECFDGSIWVVSIGGSGGVVSVSDMDDFSNIYTLILG